MASLLERSDWRPREGSPNRWNENVALLWLEGPAICGEGDGERETGERTSTAAREREALRGSLMTVTASSSELMFSTPPSPPPLSALLSPPPPPPVPPLSAPPVSV